MTIYLLLTIVGPVSCSDCSLHLLDSPYKRLGVHQRGMNIRTESIGAMLILEQDIGPSQNTAWVNIARTLGWWFSLIDTNTAKRG